MSGTGPRFAVFPTRMSLTILEARLKSAEKGKNLIKRKSDAIQIKHRDMAARLYAKKVELEKEIEGAFFLLTRAEFYGGDLKLAVHQAKREPISVKVAVESIAGVSIPAYSMPDSLKNMCFVGQSGRLMTECRNQFILCLKLLVEIASMQTSFQILDEVLLSTNRRVNALEHILIPKLENTINYIKAELDEQDREEFFRLKKIQSKGN